MAGGPARHPAFNAKAAVIAVWVVGIVIIAVASLATGASIEVAGFSRAGLIVTIVANLAGAAIVSMFVGFIAAVWIFGMP